MSKSKQKNLLIIGLVVVVIMMAIGYAAFVTQLNISGTATISSNWCIGFDNTKTSTYEVTKGKSTGETPTGSMTYGGATCQSIASTTATLSSSFKQPGDKVEYTLTILNKGNIDATIESIKVDNVTKTSTFTTTKGNIKFTVEMPATNNLAATSGSTTMKVTAEFQNDTDISVYTTGETQSINIEINAGQGSGAGGESGGGSGGESSEPTIIYGNWLSTYPEMPIGSPVGIIQNPVNSGNQTVNPSRAYFKYITDGNIIQYVEVCMISVSGSEFCLKSNEYVISKSKLQQAALDNGGTFDDYYEQNYGYVTGRNISSLPCEAAAKTNGYVEIYCSTHQEGKPVSYYIKPDGTFGVGAGYLFG